MARVACPPGYAQSQRCAGLLSPGSSPRPASGRTLKHSWGGKSPCSHTYSRGCSSLGSAGCGCCEPVPWWLHSQQCECEQVRDNLLIRCGSLLAAGHKRDTDNLGMLPARTSAVFSQATPRLVRAALSWFCPSLLWHGLGASQESSTELTATACPAVCPQLRAAETQLRIAMATPGLIPSLALAQAQLKAHLQLTGWTQHKQPVTSGCSPCSYSPARPCLPLPLAAEQNHWVQRAHGQET